MELRQICIESSLGTFLKRAGCNAMRHRFIPVATVVEVWMRRGVNSWSRSGMPALAPFFLLLDSTQWLPGDTVGHGTGATSAWNGCHKRGMFALAVLP